MGASLELRMEIKIFIVSYKLADVIFDVQKNLHLLWPRV